jgi:hypothetical protein
MAGITNIDDLQKYIDFSVGPRLPIDAYQTLRGEAYVGVITIRTMDSRLRNSSGLYPNSKDSKREGMPAGFVARAQMARHLERWTKVLLASKPYREDPIQTLEIAGKAGGQEEEFFSLLDGGTDSSMIGAGLAGALRRSDATWLALATLGRVRQYKTEHGDYPRRLSEIGPIPKDPFSDRALRYVRKDDEVRVYSVGRDGVDNFGKTSNEAFLELDNKRRDGDVPMQYDEAAIYPPLTQDTIIARIQAKRRSSR